MNNAAPETTQAAASPAVVVICHKGSLDLMQRVWKQMLEDAHIIFIENDSENELSLLDQLGMALAHPEITPTFVLVPANIIPCSRITLNDLMTPVVYVCKDGSKVHSATVPMTFDLEKAITMIREITEDVDDPTPEELNRLSEEFARKYAEHRTRPLEVGLSFGNYISPVTRGTPCGNKVIEALIRKKFVSANKVGFSAITEEIKGLLK